MKKLQISGLAQWLYGHSQFNAEYFQHIFSVIAVLTGAEDDMVRLYVRHHEQITLTSTIKFHYKYHHR